MRLRAEYSNSALRDCVVEVRNLLQANAAIAEENARFSDILAVETGNARLLWCDPTEAVSSNQEHQTMDTLWGTEFEDVAQEIPTPSNQFMFRSPEGMDAVSDGVDVLHQQGLCCDSEQGLAAPDVFSPPGVVEPCALPPSSSRPQVAHGPTSLASNSRTQTQMVGETPLCDQLQRKSETKPCMGPAPDDDPVHFGASSMDASQPPINMFDLAESLEVLQDACENIQVPEHLSRPSQNQTPAWSLPHGLTTILVRNIPARLSYEQLLRLWPPDGTYNLMYLPFNFESRRRCGHAIINMTSYEAAVNFISKWHGEKLVTCSRAKRLNIGVAPVQGFFENLRQLKKRSVSQLRQNEFLPMAFIGTQQMDIKALLARRELNEVDEHELQLYVLPISTTLNTAGELQRANNQASFMGASN